MFEDIKKTFKEIKKAIQAKGVDVGECDSPKTYAAKILSISGGESLLFVPAFTVSESRPETPITIPDNVDDYPDGWSGPEGLAGRIWMSYTVVCGSTVYIPWTQPILIWDTDVVYKTFAIFTQVSGTTEMPGIPYGGNYDVDLDKLTSTITSTSASGRTYTWSEVWSEGDNWMSIGTFYDKGQVGEWSRPAYLAQGKDGKDGINGKNGLNMEFIYKLCATKEEAASVPKPYSDPEVDEYVPSGWTSTPSGVSDTMLVELCCSRKKSSDGYWTAWSNPAIFAEKTGPVVPTGMSTWYIGSDSESIVAPDPIYDPSTLGWTTDATEITLTSELPYLWSFTRFVYSNGTTYQSTAIIVRYFNDQVTVDYDEAVSRVTAHLEEIWGGEEESVADRLEAIEENSVNIENAGTVYEVLSEYTGAEKTAFANSIIDAGSATITNTVAAAVNQGLGAVQTRLSAVEGSAQTSADKLNGITGTVKSAIETITADAISNTVAEGKYIWVDTTDPDDNTKWEAYDFKRDVYPDATIQQYEAAVTALGYTKTATIDQLSSFKQTSNGFELLAGQGGTPATSLQILAGAYEGGKIILEASTVEIRGGIQAGAITASNIGANTIISSNIAAGAITANHIAAGAIDASKINTDSLIAKKVNAGGGALQTVIEGGKFELVYNGIVKARFFLNPSGEVSLQFLASNGTPTFDLSSRGITQLLAGENEKWDQIVLTYISSYPNPNQLFNTINPNGSTGGKWIYPEEDTSVNYQYVPAWRETGGITEYQNPDNQEWVTNPPYYHEIYNTTSSDPEFDRIANRVDPAWYIWETDGVDEHGSSNWFNEDSGLYSTYLYRTDALGKIDKTIFLSFSWERSSVDDLVHAQTIAYYEV